MMRNLEMNNIEETRTLNPYQKEAVLDENPACLVNANVGSGKTTVLIEKVRYLHEKKQIPYEKMAVLTFTNKAADEIAERLSRKEAELTEEELWGFGTFHSVALRILRRFLPEKTEEGAEAGEWNREFTVITPEDEMEMVLAIAKEGGYKIKYQNRLKKRMEEDYAAYRKGRTQEKYKDDLFQIFPLLEKAKRQQNKMSFADLLDEGTHVTKEQEEVLDLKWIIVDEVQDSDEKQLEFLEALKGTQTRFFAVGDPNQVIYSWRGTGPNMFFLIKHRFGAKELTLPVNYRSDEVILEAANRFLQFGGKIEGSGERGEKILVRNHYDPFIEAEYLTERIRELHEQGLPYREIAVFYRVQKQAEILEKVFERAGLPFMLPAKRKEDEDPVPEKPHMIREHFAQERIEQSASEQAEEHEQLPEEKTVEEDAVHLMTLHASKGLEFDYVFIIGMNQGLIPLRCKSIEQEEEERRLFFVGLTRARKNLELSYYTNPTIPGTYETPSNYLRMLPEELLDWEEKPGSESRKANLQKLRKDTRELIREKKQEEEEQKETRKPERKGRHPKYGEGEIISEDEMMIELEFPGYGKKQFLKAFGEVEVLKGL